MADSTRAGEQMPFLFRCRDIKMADNFEMINDSYDELLKLVAIHTRETHQITEFAGAYKDRVLKAVKAVPA